MWKNFPPVKIISKEENTMKYFDEVNLVGYGKSFDINNIKNFKKPTFLISFWSTLRQRKMDLWSYNTLKKILD